MPAGHHDSSSRFLHHLEPIASGKRLSLQPSYYRSLRLLSHALMLGLSVIKGTSSWKKKGSSRSRRERERKELKWGLLEERREEGSIQESFKRATVSFEKGRKGVFFFFGHEIKKRNRLLNGIFCWGKKNEIQVGRKLVGNKEERKNN